MKIQHSFDITKAKLTKDDLLVRFVSGSKTQLIPKKTHIELSLAVTTDSISTTRLTRRLVRRAVRRGITEKAPTIVIDVASFHKTTTKHPIDIAAIASEAYRATYSFTSYKSKPEPIALKRIVLVDPAKPKAGAIRQAVTVAETISAVRDLANTPGMDMTPRVLAAKAKGLAKGLPITVAVYDEKKMRQMKMGAVLAVGQGSAEPSRFVVMKYMGATNKKAKPIVMVGKGVTYDTGGLHVKPSGYMNEMYMDMSGAANVIGAIVAAARLGLKKNIIVLVPSAENAVSGSSYRPGDILRTMSGLTVEVQHTDAEGRLLMADALHYAKSFKPKVVVDVATLTGASLVALGTRASAVFATNDDLANQVLDAAEASGDPAWRLPLWPEFASEMKGTFGDLTNIHNKRSRYGGTVTAAAFLHQFYPDGDWVHIDMAPRMTPSPDDQMAPGATGEPLRLLVEFIRQA